ncbi:MAG: hypothetical protein FJZ56_02465 [Chlamydiae bacterium]|nr:hypothetical protein [Chlamydiota bacterium]
MELLSDESEGFFSPEGSFLPRLLEITAPFDCPEENQESFSHYFSALQNIIKRLIPEEVLDKGKFIESFQEKKTIEEFYDALEEQIPILRWSKPTNQAPYILSIAVLCSSEYTHGVGRFVSDTCSRWLIPGKQLPLVNVVSMAFRFKLLPQRGYFLHELFMRIDNPKDLHLVKANLPSLSKEIKLNILAVQHARNVIALKPLTIDQKKIIIQENIASLLDRPSREFDHNIFDQMHHFLIKVSAEEKVTQIKEQIAPLLEFRPQVFERDIYNELQYFILQFKDQFTVTRDIKHLTRIISYKYLFHKSLTNFVLSQPHQRHLSIKVLKTTIQDEQKNTPIVGVLVGINLLRENEIFEERHVLKAIQSCIPHVTKVKDSSIIDRRGSNKVRTIYLEVEKKGNATFSIQEIQELRKRLPTEIKERIESVINPIFMPRNEEEVMRNILILSNQLKYVQDIPQVVITFHKQTQTKLSFTIILLRLLKPEDKPLQKLFTKEKSSIKFSDHDVKLVGQLRKKYPKEANVFEMHLDKAAFLRKDYSLDLYEARRAVFSELTRVLGDIRDYNGGMISKQNEALIDLKKLLLQMNIHQDFLLENYFYSLNPTYMQSLIAPAILKKQFLILLEALEHDYNKQVFFLKTQIIDNYFLVVLSAINPTFKDFVSQQIEALNIESITVTSSFLGAYDISCLSYLVRFDDPRHNEEFLKTIVRSIRIWKTTLQSHVKFDPLPPQYKKKM